MRLLAAALCGLALPLLAVVPAQARADAVTSTRPPGVAGDAVYDGVLRSGPGAWSPSDVTLAYHWLRDGTPVPGATERTYRLGQADLGHRMSVRVTATDADGGTGRATSDPTAPVVRATLRATRAPAVDGVQRFFRTVSADPAAWSSKPTRVRYQWLRDGDPIGGADRRRYTYAPADVGHRVRVRETATAPGYTTATTTSAPHGRVRNRVDVRRRVTYSVATRGHVTANLAQFRRLAQQTYDDPRGWLAKGVQFRPVAHGGSFTLVLAEAAQVPSFSSGCSSEYSCRVGRYVIINQTRWLHATSVWTSHGGTLRDYRNLVVDHETGHWLGYHHSGCPGPGRLAPVMMQQSKGLDGCRINPWPTLAELNR